MPCIRLDHLTDEQRREYAIAHNATAELSQWDFSILGNEISDLRLNDFDFDFIVDFEDEVMINDVELKPYEKVHYLISVNVNLNDEIIPYIEMIRKISCDNFGGVEIESTLN